ncbi:MAG TPA: nicotinate phosphoribosyltransferase, partial [Balneolaceae bacterium]|nr:nicotinate phosphoribosyltransferase [Balneolaceae bacterium]
TKARRMRYAAGERGVLDFGLRRAQGLGGMQATKAAAIGGVQPTSNVLAAFKYNIAPSGTMAHSWIQSFDDELTAFRSYARHYPDDCILLVDTYDTLAQGVPHAITVAKELEKDGHRLKGIRLDSGDLTYFSRKARNQLDRAGLEYVKIAASNQLDEHLITSLINQKAPIDLFGVGTRLVTGNETPALDGVYKLNSINDEPKLKISENVEKITLPGAKKTMRYLDEDDNFLGDGVWLIDEKSPQRIYHPFISSKSSDVSAYKHKPIQQTVMKNGELTVDIPTVDESAAYTEKRFKKLNMEHKRFEHPHIYKVGVSEKLLNLRDDLIDEAKNGHRRRVR